MHAITEELIKEWENYKHDLFTLYAEYYELLKRSYRNDKTGELCAKQGDVVVILAEPDKIPQPTFTGFMDHLSKKLNR